MCQQIISDSESLLTDDRLLSLSASHRKFLREKLKRAIIQVRTIQQEASAYDSSQLPNANSILRFFSRGQPNLVGLSEKKSLDNKDDPDQVPKSSLPNPGTLLSNAELAVNGTAGPRFNISLFRTCTCISILVFLIASLISKNDIINNRLVVARYFYRTGLPRLDGILTQFMQANLN